MIEFKNYLEYSKNKKFKISKFNPFIVLPKIRELNGINFIYDIEKNKIILEFYIELKFLAMDCVYLLLESEESGNKRIKINENTPFKVDFEKIDNFKKNYNEFDQKINLNKNTIEILYNSKEDIDFELDYVFYLEIEGYHPFYFLWKQLDEYNDKIV